MYYLISGDQPVSFFLKFCIFVVDFLCMVHRYLFLLSFIMEKSTGKLCIEVTPAAKIAFISEELCIGCGICVKVCT